MSLLSINKDYTTSNIALKQVQTEAYIRSTAFREIVTKYDLNGPNIDS